MSKKLITAFAFAIVLSVASGRVARDAPANPDTSISEIYTEIANGIKLFQANVMEVLGVKNADELQEKASATGKDIAAKLDSWANDIKKDTEDWKNLPAIKSLQETAQKTVEEFKSKNPQTAEEIQALYAKATQGTEEIVQKIKAIGESEDAHKLKDLSKKLLDSASNAVQNIAKDFQENKKQ